MFGTRLLSAFLALLALTLALAGIAYWGAIEARYQLERSRLAHQVLEGHLRLSADTYDLFRQIADPTALHDPARAIDENQARARLQATLNRLRDLIASEVAFVATEEERRSEKDELLELARLERQIAQVLDGFTGVEALSAEGRSAEGWRMLNRILDERIDRGFHQRIEAAIAGEAEEVEAADREARAVIQRQKQVATVAGGAAVLLSVTALAFLLRTFRRPIARLLDGTEALAAGRLGHRIPVEGPREFARLATSFNRMASDLERNQSELCSARDALERAVDERTLELEQANRALRRADEVRRRFFADISHELRTPLTVIRGEGEIALRGKAKTTEEYQATLHRIVEQADQLGRLVDDLLMIARADAGAPRLTHAAVALNRLLRQVCGDAGVLARSKGVRIELVEADEDVVLSADHRRLRQLFLILLDNAIRYSGPGSAVRIDSTAGAGAVLVQVTDQGAGIAPEELTTVFERFSRGDAAREQHVEGLGLGLPVARAIALAHQGEIEIESAPGAGTTVRVRLPASSRQRAIA